MAKNQRVFPGQATQDPSSITVATYNEVSGAQKNTDVGRHLLALNDGAGGWTTDATTVRKLPSKGRNLAVYNNNTAIAAVTLGDSTYVPTAQAAGAVQAATAGRNVGIPCTPGNWTYIACGEQDQVIASAATLLVFLIDDATSIKTEVK